MNFKIKQAEPEDLAGINEIYNFYIKTSNATFDTSEWDDQLRRDWYLQFTENRDFYKLFVAKLNGKVIGFAYNLKFKEKQAYFTSSEVTIYIESGVHGKGIGTELYKALFSSISKSRIHRLYAVITLPNDASIRLHEKFDFHTVGTMTEVGFKNGQYHSTVILQKDFTQHEFTGLS